MNIYIYLYFMISECLAIKQKKLFALYLLLVHLLWSKKPKWTSFKCANSIIWAGVCRNNASFQKRLYYKNNHWISILEKTGPSHFFWSMLTHDNITQSCDSVWMWCLRCGDEKHKENYYATFKKYRVFIERYKPDFFQLLEFLQSFHLYTYRFSSS